jgi:hypothetical protein
VEPRVVVPSRSNGPAAFPKRSTPQRFANPARRRARGDETAEGVWNDKNSVISIVISHTLPEVVVPRESVTDRYQAAGSTTDE